MAVNRKPRPKADAPPKSLPPRKGMYPDADPTAPGGMSQAELRLELAERHGVPMNESRAMTWKQQIDAVCTERRAREIEAEVDQVFDKAEPVAHTQSDGSWCREHNPGCPLPHDDDQPLDVVDEDDDFSDLDFDDEPDTEPDTDPDDPAALFAPEVIAERKAFEVANTPEPLFIGMPDSFDYIFSGHYGASPSGSERWAHCTASLEASRVFLETLTPNQQAEFAGAGTAARQGTTAHAAGEAELLLMLGQISQDEYDHAMLELTLDPPEDEAYDTEMAEHLTEYVDYVRQLHDAGRPLLVESRVRAKVWLVGHHDEEIHEIPGSADCIALPTDEENVLTVADLKYGNGLDVSVEANPQVRIYALGALALLAEANGGDLPELDAVEYVIVQPRLGGIKVWREPLDDLLDWRDEFLAPALTAALFGSNNYPEHQSSFSPSEAACQWCPARGGCAALAEDRMKAGSSMFDEVMGAEVSGNPIDPMLLSNERLGDVLAQIMTVVDLRDDLKAEAQRRLHRGQHVPNFELVNYTPPSSWKDGAKTQIAEAIEEGTLPSLYKPAAIVTPTQARTLLKESSKALEFVTSLIDVHPVVPVVGPDEARRKARGDKRKSWNGRAPEDMFAVEGGDDPTDHTPTSIESMFATLDDEED